MRKQWLGICIAASLLAACTSDDGQNYDIRDGIKKSALL